MKKPFYKRLWFRVLAVFIILGALFGNGDNESKEVERPTSEIAAISAMATEPATEEITEPVTEPETEPVTEEVTEPVTEEVTEPETEPITEPVTEPETEEQTEAYVVTYIGNMNTKKFHYQDCSSVSDMKESNKTWIEGRDEAINRGYVACKRCDP